MTENTNLNTELENKDNGKESKRKILASNLHYLRSLAGLTQQRVADKLGINRTSYTKWETGVISPSLEMISRLIDFYNGLIVINVTIDYNFILSERKS